METLYTDEQKDQFTALLTAYPAEVAGLRAALVEGRINGGKYWDEGCGCVIGTIAHLHDCDLEDMPFYEDEELSAIEVLVKPIRPGDTPASNPVSALLLAWIDDHAKGAE